MDIDSMIRDLEVALRNMERSSQHHREWSNHATLDESHRMYDRGWWVGSKEVISAVRSIVLFYSSADADDREQE